MIKKVNFFTQDERWFADIKGHTLEQNEMVSGADLFLDTMDRYFHCGGHVTMTLSDDCAMNGFLIKLVRCAHNQFGATYVITGPLAERFGAVGKKLWICNVTHDVLGEHPQSIYLHAVASW